MPLHSRMTGPAQFAVLGNGAWGTALAIAIQAAGRSVTLWGRDADIVSALDAGKGNPAFLPGISLPPVPASTDMDIVNTADAILAVVPAQATRALLETAAPHVRPGVPVILCAKGIEQDTLKLMTDVLAETVPHAMPCVLSGPSFAHDVARGLPTAVTLACRDEAMGRALVQAIGRPAFRPYWVSDLVGAEVGGAVKNVLAIACGIIEGLELGRSAHAALIARGFAEMRRLAVAMGARENTLSGLCGLGDLVLTCSSSQSRNMRLGLELGKGRTMAAISADGPVVVEGVATAPAVVALAARHGIDMPICRAVAGVVSGSASVQDAVTDLLQRPFTEEA